MAHKIILILVLCLLVVGCRSEIKPLGLYDHTQYVPASFWQDGKTIIYFTNGSTYAHPGNVDVMFSKNDTVFIKTTYGLFTHKTILNTRKE